MRQITKYFIKSCCRDRNSQKAGRCYRGPEEEERDGKRRGWRWSLTRTKPPFTLSGAAAVARANPALNWAWPLPPVPAPARVPPIGRLFRGRNHHRRKRRILGTPSRPASLPEATFTWPTNPGSSLFLERESSFCLFFSLNKKGS